MVFNVEGSVIFQSVKKTTWLVKNAGTRPMLASALAATLLLSGCQGGIDSVFPKAEKPLPRHLIKKIKAKGMSTTSPILLRIFKTENVMEVWKQKPNKRYDLLESYEICKWSGKLGPKFKEGDRQAPEGFYSVGRGQMNPKSKYHLSFNIGFPNRYDRAHNRTGRHLMVHGACSSAGCYSMTDERVEEIYALARDAFKGGQKKFQVQAFPFRLTPKNMAKNVDHKDFEFWKMLKEGYDHFELTKIPPKVDVCEKRYLFNRVAEKDSKFSSRDACPKVTMPGSLILAYSERREKEQDIFSKVLKRQISRAKLSGRELALAPSNMTLIAKGSEILPPPTPKPVPPKPKIIPVPQSAPALVSAQPVLPNGTISANVAIANVPANAPVTTAPVATAPAAAPQITNQTPQTVATQNGGTLTTTAGGQIIDLGQPAQPAPTASQVQATAPATIPVPSAPNTNSQQIEESSVVAIGKAAAAKAGHGVPVKVTVDTNGNPLYYYLANGERYRIPSTNSAQ